MKNKYEVLGIVGEGAYGVVYKCKNKETNKFVAIKKFKETEDELVQKTMKRELAMLQMLKHENVVEFQEAFVSKGNFFLVFEYVEKNLLEVLEESPKGLSPKLIRYFVFQMCKAVSYLHKNNMIHRDVKPENLLIDENLNLKLCDFGFARKVKLNRQNNNIDTMTDYVATRWYRSPELLLSGGIYGPEVDYWAIGCIMGELADGNPMFPGENEVDQLDCIIKILGNLPEDLVNMYYENPIYNEKEILRVKKPETLEKRYLGILSPTAIDFMKGLLQLDPNKRLNDDTVFKHKYFSVFMNNNEDKNNNISNSTSNNINKIRELKNNLMSKNMINKEENITNKIEKSERNNKAEMNISNNKSNNFNSTMTNNNMKLIPKNIINSKNKKETETKGSNTMPTKVINNTTNINIINYNLYNNSPNKNNIQIPKKILDMNQKNQFKKLTNQDNITNINKTKQLSNDLTLINSNENFYENKNHNMINIQKKLDNFAKSMISFNNININNKSKTENKNNNSKKSSSMNKINNENSVLDISQKMPTFNIISLSQGKKEKKKQNKEMPKPNNTFYNVNLNVIHNNNYSKNSNFLSLFNKGYSTNGFKSFYMNKDNKYNYKINTKYIKEENKKYLYNNSFNDKNIIDEKDEFDINNSNIYDYKKKSYSKEKHNKKLLVPYGSQNYEIYNPKFYKNNNGYGTFYNYNKNNILFGNKKKTGNTKYNNNVNKLPKLYKSISNVTQYNNFGYNKNKTKSNNFYFKGKNGFNPYNYDYNSKFRIYMP
jgi:cyclin-dependent kinase-like